MTPLATFGSWQIFPILSYLRYIASILFLVLFNLISFKKYRNMLLCILYTFLYILFFSKKIGGLVLIEVTCVSIVLSDSEQKVIFCQYDIVFHMRFIFMTSIIYFSNFPPIISSQWMSSISETNCKNWNSHFVIHF